MKIERPLWRVEIDVLEAGLDELGIESVIPAEDQVILRYLREGDIRPLADLLQHGHEPGFEVMDLLANMLSDDGDTTYRLKSVRRDGKAGRPFDQTTLARDALLAVEVQLLMRQGQTYEIAVRAVAVKHGVSFETVRDAYDESPRDLIP